MIRNIPKSGEIYFGTTGDFYFGIDIFGLGRQIRLSPRIRGQRKVSLYSRDPFPQTHEVTADIVETDVDLREAAIDFGEAAAKFGPDIGHIATLLRLSLKNRAQQKSDRGDRHGHLSGADPCALAHCTTLTAKNKLLATNRNVRFWNK